MNFVEKYFEEVKQIASSINQEKVEEAVNVLRTTRDI